MFTAPVPDCEKEYVMKDQLEYIRDIQEMLDLRSDTSTKPTPHMWEAMAKAELGDGGRVDLTGRGEDATVFQLEALAAKTVGKGDAMYLPTGSLANHVANYTVTKRGDIILLEEMAHIFYSEKSDFMEDFGGRKALHYHLTKDYQIDLDEVKRLLDEHPVKELCLENTHNYSGGTCLTPATTQAVCELAHRYGVHVHLDGARIFNAAVALGCDVKELTEPVDSLMFCVSKGLCAPVGSLLRGSEAFIADAFKTAKLMGTLMRQAGVIAAAGIVALEENIGRLAEDHKKAKYLGERLSVLKNCIMDPAADQSDFVYLNPTPAGKTAQQVVDDLKARGLLVARMTDDSVRFAVHKDISMEDVELAADIAVTYFEELAEQG